AGRAKCVHSHVHGIVRPPTAPCEAVARASLADEPEISVIIRARDEAASIGRCLELLAAQRTGDRGVEVLVVDSGSRDGTPEIARANPRWGYSNGAGGFRASLWRKRPFRADLPGCEDREWALFWLERGYCCVVDPSLVVDHDHTHDSLPSIYRRARREAEGLARFADGAADPERGLVGEWW